MSVAFPHGFSAGALGDFNAGESLSKQVSKFVGIPSPQQLAAKALKKSSAGIFKPPSNSNPVAFVADAKFSSSSTMSAAPKGSRFRSSMHKRARSSTVVPPKPVSHSQLNVQQSTAINKLSKQVASLKKESHVTVNTLDTASNGTVATAWQFAGVSAIAEGDTFAQRTGRKTLLRHIQGSISLHQPNGGANRSAIIRFVLVYFGKSLVVASTGLSRAPLFGDVFASNGYSSHYAKTGSNKYTVLYDKTWVLANSTTEANSGKFVKFSEKIGKIQTYKGSAGADYDTGQMFWCLAQQFQGTSFATFDIASRLSFIP